MGATGVEGAGYPAIHRASSTLSTVSALKLSVTDSGREAAGGVVGLGWTLGERAERERSDDRTWNLHHTQETCAKSLKHLPLGALTERTEGRTVGALHDKRTGLRLTLEKLTGSPAECSPLAGLACPS